MRWLIPGICALAMAFSSAAMAQEDPKPDELKRMYESSQQQLKAAQDRKNELANEVENLNKRLIETQKQLDSAQANEASFAERTYQLRSTLVAWDRFLESYPVLKGRWQAYLQTDLLDGLALPTWVDPPAFKLIAATTPPPAPAATEPVTQPTSQPASNPATQPTTNTTESDPHPTPAAGLH